MLSASLLLALTPKADAFDLGPNALLPRFVALPDIPRFVDGAGKAVDPRGLMFREFTFVREDAGGVKRFLVDRRWSVATGAKDPYCNGALRPIVESGTLARLRQSYVGRRLWNCGTLVTQRESPNPRASATTNVDAGKPLRIVRIFQLARVPAKLGELQFSYIRGQMLPTYKASDYGKGAPFLIVYRLPSSELSGHSGDNSDPRRYGPPYSFLIGDWQLERMISTEPPTASDLRGVRKLDRAYSAEDGLKGLTRRQVAWCWGWPMEPTPLSRLLFKPVWVYGDQFVLSFRRGRVSKVEDFTQGLPH